MRRRLRELVRNRAVQQAGDIVVALVLAVTSVGGVLSGEPSWGSTRSVALVLALASTLPIVWRARRPVLASAIVFAANGGCVIAAAPYEASLQPFVALSLVAYSLGSRAEGRSAKIAPPVLAALSATAFVVAVAVGQTSGHVIPSFVWLCATWAVGRVVRALRLRADELEVALRELEQQRELQAEAAVAVERGRIARELHDVIAHNVSMMVVQAAAASRVLQGEQPDVRTALEAIEGSGRQTVEEMRRLIGVVRADDGLALAPQPTLGDLEQLTDKLRHAGLPVELRLEGEPASLAPGIDLCAYRIVQEALTNTLKHAGPAHATVTVRYTSGAVELEIVDDGDATGNGAGSGNGLIGMRERALLWGGELHSGHLAGGGWGVHARLPLRTP